MDNVLKVLDGSVWAITESGMDQIMHAIEGMEHKDVLEAAKEEKSLVENATKNRGVLEGDKEFKYEDDMYEVNGSMATMPVYGKMFPRANMMTRLSGGVSTRKLGRAIDEVEEREDIDKLMMVFDSPGGSIQGLTNTASKVRNMETETVAFAEGLMASAAYFVGSAADRVVASPDSMVGAIGSVAKIVSRAGKLEEEGYDVEVIRSAEKKAKPNPSEPIDEDSVKEVQKLVDAAHEQFVRQVATNLDISEETVSNTMADGSVINGSEAEGTNFVDDVATIDEVMDEFEGSVEEESEESSSAIQFLQNRYTELRERHEAVIEENQELRSELSDLREEKREQEIEQTVQSAIYDEQKIAPGKEDELRAQLENNFEGTKQMLDLMDEGSAAPSDSPQPDTERQDDPATEQEAIRALRSQGIKVATDQEAAETFDKFNAEYVMAEDAVEEARDRDLL
jgi:signal peptide peptidase SppA